ncbi:MAG: hypothetical protein PQJ58_18575 [Spirochaetales bacterium]|nr:hypothetical protein [Spirochaetales bacterium]
MPQYCVDKKRHHEVHKDNCLFLDIPDNRIDFEAMNDFDAMEQAHIYYPEAYGCAICMRTYYNQGLRVYQRQAE